MARLQILELPEGVNDDRPPFILVIDQMPTDETGFDALRRDLGTPDDLLERIGARAVLVFEDTIDIPANDTSVYLRDGEAEEQAEPQRADERAIQAEEKLKAFMEKRYAIELERRASLTDALGVDRLRDWDDIHNAASGLRKQRGTLAKAIERVNNLHRPVEHRGQVICWECSDYDFPGQTTDSPPVLYDQCATLRALDDRQKQQ
ncbi:hypothetical protein [Streptomyces sp. NPDC126503]|uniref:hypothetical protein n=1 Tax=Streptomyces sp. NPDC126503 TaxID=3155315 RepID=UPI003327D873